MGSACALRVMASVKCFIIDGFAPESPVRENYVAGENGAGELMNDFIDLHLGRLRRHKGRKRICNTHRWC